MNKPKSRTRNTKFSFSIVIDVALALIVILYLTQLGHGGDYYNEDGSYKHITSDSSFKYIVNHPGLEGLGEEVLPLGNKYLRSISTPLKLKLMIPFLGKDEATVVDGLNYAIDAAQSGNSTFISYYSDADKSQDPAKEDTGLLFFKTADNAPFVVVAPGGGFTMLGVASSAYPYIKPLQEAGYNVFVLEYRVGIYDGEDDKIPASNRAAEDMVAAVQYILENANSLGVSPESYIVMGSSAGGQVTARFCAEQEYNTLGFAAPSACIMLYPANCERYDYTGCTIPTYITVCEDDPKINVAGLDTAVNAMKDAGMEVSYNKFATGGHSFGLGVGTPAEGWMQRSLEWVKDYIK